MVGTIHIFEQNKISIILFAEMRNAHIFIWMTLWMITGISMAQVEAQPELHRAGDVNSTLYLVYQTNKISPDTSDITGTPFVLQEITLYL